MKRAAGTLAALLLLAGAALALEVPPAPTQWVTDRAGILEGGASEALNAKLRSFEERTGTQFIIYILPSLEGDSLEDFSIRAAEKWRVGQAKYDNGLILFVFPQDRKLRIEVGYGLEGTVTDAISSRVIRQDIVPAFQAGNYAAGLDAAADHLIAFIEKGEEPHPVPRGTGGAPGGGIPFWVFLLIPLFVIFVLGPMSGRGCGPACWLPFMMGGGTTFGGGHYRGGGGFGGFSGGGGFGGFSGGGGGFGGGGASGSW
ncbi:MAG TPA: TPM domain-containing protein [Thermoanaerobaculia bacterium]|nr:TPM domain-containing protein [Thermoanaerobaculia bacterium]